MKNLKFVDLNKPLIKKILPLRKDQFEKTKKLSKVKIGFAVLCVLFSISIGANIIMFLNSLDKKISSNLGTAIICDLKEPSNQTYSIYYPSGILGGINYNQPLTISNSSESSLYIRIKATSNHNNSNLQPSYLNVNSDWIFKNGYYYFNKPMQSLEKFLVFDKVSFSNTFSKYKNNVLTVQIECLSDLNIAILSWDRPENWLT